RRGRRRLEPRPPDAPQEESEIVIIGAHSIIYSKDADADRAFLRDVLKLTHVDAGEGWLIFGLPPAEVAIHPDEANDRHELYLLCDDVQDFTSAMAAKGVACDPVRAMGWGMLTQIVLPGGGRVGVYQPRHARPKPVGAAAASVKAASARPRKAATRRTS